MPTTNYLTIGGELISQNKAGVRNDLLSDPTGSVIGTIGSGGTISNRTSYWPKGEVRMGGVSSVAAFSVGGAYQAYAGLFGMVYMASISLQLKTGKPLQNKKGLGIPMPWDPPAPKPKPIAFPAPLPKPKPIDWWHGGSVSRPPVPPEPIVGSPLNPYMPLIDPSQPWFTDPGKCAMDWLGIPGGGAANYAPGITPLDFGYGSCCGAFRACNSPSEGWLDCLDLACAYHDSSIPDLGAYMHKAPHQQFCASLWACDCSKYHKNALDLRNCEDAKWRMGLLFCAHSVSPWLK